MMAGRFRTYSWQDILRLVQRDAGLPDDDAMADRGEVCFLNLNAWPEDMTRPVLRIDVHDKSFAERKKERFDR